MICVLCLQVPPLEGYTALQILELSYNRISSLRPLNQLQSLKLDELYVANNTVQQIEVSCRVHLCPLLGVLREGREPWMGMNRGPLSKVWCAQE